MMEFSMRQPAISIATHSWPSESAFLASTLQRFQPEPSHSIPEGDELLQIARHSVVTVVPLNHRLQPFTLLGHGLMHSFSQLGFHFGELASHFLRNRMPPDRKRFSLFSDSPTDVGEPEEVEGFRFPEITLLSVVGRKAAKFQNPRLLGMKFQAELEHALFEVSQKLLGLRFVLKPNNKVVGPAHDDHLTARFVPSSLLRPEVQNVVKINVRRQGANAPALRLSFFRFCSKAINHDTRLEPLPDQADHFLIPNSMLDELNQPIVAEVIEKSSDVAIQNPVHFAEQTHVQGVEAVVLPFSRSVSVGEIKKVCLIDRVQNFSCGAL